MLLSSGGCMNSFFEGVPFHLFFTLSQIKTNNKQTNESKKGDEVGSKFGRKTMVWWLSVCFLFVGFDNEVACVHLLFISPFHFFKKTENAMTYSTAYFCCKKVTIYQFAAKNESDPWHSGVNDIKNCIAVIYNGNATGHCHILQYLLWMKKVDNLGECFGKIPDDVQRAYEDVAANVMRAAK